MAGKTLNIGMVGYKFMGRTHSNAWRQAARFFDVPFEPVLHTICGRNPAGVQSAAKQLGWLHTCTDWRELVENPEIDVVDISTANDTHAEIAIAAARRARRLFVRNRWRAPSSKPGRCWRPSTRRVSSTWSATTIAAFPPWLRPAV